MGKKKKTSGKWLQENGCRLYVTCCVCVVCVCVWETVGWVFSCVIMLIVQNERMFSVSPTIQPNSFFCL